MIDVRQSPALDRIQRRSLTWNTARTDFDPPAAEVSSDLEAANDRFHRALARTGDDHLLYGRWLVVGSPLRPFVSEPFMVLGRTCREIALGLSIALRVGCSETEDANLFSIAKSGLVTDLHVHLPEHETGISEAYLGGLIDRLAASPIGLNFCGDVARYRRIGAMELVSLRCRQHRFVPSDPARASEGRHS